MIVQFGPSTVWSTPVGGSTLLTGPVGQADAYAARKAMTLITSIILHQLDNINLDVEAIKLLRYKQREIIAMYKLLKVEDALDGVTSKQLFGFPYTPDLDVSI